eukprot:TRINITY_DN14152_c1_g1_i1.p1 TRINITY_DN14152_c1_g1~~TRINITY_DN14152_c1_g1_i1.p1  ORF type:complete len:525 (+),score=86.06 TRINITY_DN14152_c1_g1_i1:42-1577(+)
MADAYRSASSPHLLRRQQSRNCVLVKDDVGRARPSCRELPPKEHAYGLQEPLSHSGVGDAFAWQTHLPSAPPRGGTDFQRLHRAAPRHRACTPKQLGELRADYGDSLEMLPLQRHRTPPSVLPSDVIPNFAYGRRGRPSTPIGAVLAHQQGNVAEEVIEERYRRYDEARESASGPFKIKLTKAARLRRRPKEEPSEPEEPWKMNKFKKAPARIKQEAPLYRDEDGRLQRRCNSTMRVSASLPNLQRASVDASEEGIAVHSEDEHDDADSVLGRTTFDMGSPDTDMDVESESSWSPLLGSLLDTEDDDAAFGGEVRAASPPQQVRWDTEADVRTIEGAEVQLAQGETPVTIWLTVRAAAPEDLQLVTRVLQRCIRTRFDDGVVKLNDFVLEPERQGLRGKLYRYVAWGQGALKPRGVPDGVAAALAPMTVTLTVRHQSIEELKTTTCAVVESIRRCLSEDVLQVRGVSPPFWSPPPPPKLKPRLRDGLGRPLPTPGSPPLKRPPPSPQKSWT